MIERGKLLTKMGLSPDATDKEINIKYEKLSEIFRKNLNSENQEIKEKATRNLNNLNDIYSSLSLDKKLNNFSDKKNNKNEGSKDISHENNNIICTKCFSALSANDKFCNKCGMMIVKANIKKPALGKYGFFMIILIIVIGLTLFLNVPKNISNIEIVRNSSLAFDKSLTVGSAFENYKGISTYNWEEIQSSDGREYVVFKGSEKGELLYEALIGYLTLALKQGHDDGNEFLNTKEQWTVRGTDKQIGALPAGALSTEVLSMVNLRRHYPWALESIEIMEVLLPIYNKFKEEKEEIENFQIMITFIINTDDTIEIVDTNGIFTFNDGSTKEINLSKNTVLNKIYFNHIDLGDILLSYSNVDINKWKYSDRYFKK